MDGGITEISREGGSGKMQICLSLCVVCVTTCSLLPLRPRGRSDRDRIPSTIASDDDDDDVHLRCAGSSSSLDDGHHHAAIYVSMGEGAHSVTVAR